MTLDGDGPFNFVGNVLAEWQMRRLIRVLKEGGKITLTIEIPQKGEKEQDHA